MLDSMSSYTQHNKYAVFGIMLAIYGYYHTAYIYDSPTCFLHVWYTVLKAEGACLCGMSVSRSCRIWYGIHACPKLVATASRFCNHYICGE